MSSARLLPGERSDGGLGGNDATLTKSPHLHSPLPSRGSYAPVIQGHPWFVTARFDWPALVQRVLPAPWRPRLENELDTSCFNAAGIGLSEGPLSAVLPPFESEVEWCRDF